MPVHGFNLVSGPIDSGNTEQGPTPAWAPGWMPSKPSLDYMMTLASFTFLILGSLYFLGVSPLRGAARAKAELSI